jgi:hypothetical protein
MEPLTRLAPACCEAWRNEGKRGHVARAPCRERVAEWRWDGGGEAVKQGWTKAIAGLFEGQTDRSLFEVYHLMSP